MRPVLDYLRGRGVVPGPEAACGVGRTAVEIELWDSFQSWGVDQRGLLALTAEGCARRAEACLRCGRPESKLVVADLDAGSVLAAVRAAVTGMRFGEALRLTPTRPCCYKSPVAALLPWLSAWLGHAQPKDTYWYLSAVPELLAAAS